MNIQEAMNHMKMGFKVRCTDWYPMAFVVLEKESGEFDYSIKDENGISLGTLEDHWDLNNSKSQWEIFEDKYPKSSTKKDNKIILLLNN